MTRNVWKFVVGSHLYGLNDEKSDVDMLVVSNEGAVSLDPVAPQAGPESVDSVRHSSPRLMVDAILLGFRWAWEAWISSPILDKDTWLALRDPLLDSHLSMKVLGRGLKRYASRYMPEAMSNTPRTDRPDHVQWWRESGWHHKIGYYLMISSHFARNFPDVGFSGDDIVFMMDLKYGHVGRDEWLSRWHRSTQFVIDDTQPIDSEKLMEWKRSVLRHFVELRDGE